MAERNQIFRCHSRAGPMIGGHEGMAGNAAIDDHEERYRLWAEYFEAEAVEILAFDLDYFQTRPAEQEFSGTSHFGDACP